MDNLNKFYQEFCHYSSLLRMAAMVQASSPTTTDTVNNPRRA